MDIIVVGNVDDELLMATLLFATPLPLLTMLFPITGNGLTLERLLLPMRDLVDGLLVEELLISPYSAIDGVGVRDNPPASILSLLLLLLLLRR